MISSKHVDHHPLCRQWVIRSHWLGIIESSSQFLGSFGCFLKQNKTGLTTLTRFQDLPKDFWMLIHPNSGLTADSPDLRGFNRPNPLEFFVIFVSTAPSEGSPWCRPGIGPRRPLWASFVITGGWRGMGPGDDSYMLTQA